MTAPSIETSGRSASLDLPAGSANAGEKPWLTGFLSRIASALRPRANPILRRELRVRMRGRRAFIVLGAYLVLIALVTFAIERILVSESSGNGLQSFQVGQILFAGFATLEMTLITLVTPALTATAISGERERGTFDLLRSTPVRSHTIVWGKLVAALSYAALLIVASVPFASAVFLFGGVAPSDVWIAFALLGLTTLTFGLLGLLCSAVARKAGLASAIAYVISATVLVGSAGSYVFWDAVDGGLVDAQTFDMKGNVIVQADPVPNGGAVVGMAGPGVAGGSDVSDSGGEPPRILLSLNPMMALASLLSGAVDESQSARFSGQSSAMGLINDALDFFRIDDTPDGQIFFDQNGQPVQTQPEKLEPLWHDTLWIYAITSIVLLILTSIFVARLDGRPRRWRLPRWRLRRPRFGSAG